MTRILFVELLGGIGDLLLALPAIHALAHTHAPAHMTVLTFAPGGALLRADPHVQRVVHANGSARGSVAAVLGEGFDLVVSDTCYDDIPALLRERGPAQVVTNLWRNPPPDERIDLRFLRLLAADGLIDPTLARLPPRLYLTAEEIAAGHGWLAGLTRPVVLVVAEAGMPIKQWPLDRWRGLREALGGFGIAAITGAHPSLAAAAAGDAGLVLPRLPLREAAAVVAAADACVAADTGLARVAAAAGTPTVCLFGPTVSGRFGLREAGPVANRNLDSPLPCPVRHPLNMTEQSCWYSGRCAYEDRVSCMEDISVPTVAAAVRSLLEAI